MSDTRIDHLGRWPVNYIRGHARGITLGTRGVQESQVSILWNCGLWAHHVVFFIGAVTSCTVMIARHVKEYPVSYVGNTLVPRARDEENQFPAH